MDSVRVYSVIVFFGILTSHVHMKITCRCGRDRPRAVLKVIGGSPTRPHQYPWAAVVMRRMIYLGVGSIINNRYIMTAAHVVEGTTSREVNLALGVHNRITMQNSTIMNVVKVISHPKFHPEKLHNDIALLKTASTINFINYHVGPICLPTNGFPSKLYALTLAGWGARKYGGSPVRVLNSVVLHIVPWDKCKENPVYTLIKKAGVSPDTFICAMYPLKDACQGDSGAPLSYYDMGKQIIIGIVSFGYKCGEPGYAGLYTNVTMYMDWIMKETSDADYCYE